MEKENELIEEIHWLHDDEYDSTQLHNLTKVYAPLDNLSLSVEDLDQVLYEGFGTDYEYEIPTVAEEYFEAYKPQYYAEDIVLAKPPIVCKPLPGPFMPCVDLFGCWLLRCGVWLVFLLAVLGNGVVLFVSVSSRSKMDVPRFLICNLACSDFCMGIYLGFLAFVDASTLGEFKKHAIKWQTSPGCLIAGFLGVLSSELSVFTLTVITLERFYAITHAMQLNKRLSLKRAGYIMIGGWMFAILVATLPLFGISDYRKFAVCLPFEIGDTASLGYVCFIMLFNGISFSVIVSCYMKMYCSIRGSHAWNSNDTRVAKRMALLVFTDFACWAPITFFALTAAFGKELISLDDAKIFTIFVLPLNSCANPFLYAILTKQFKKDCVKLCKRLEETAVSRRLTRISNRNGSSWSSSRRPSGANSFFNVEKRESNTVSGGLVNYNVDLNNSGQSRTATTWTSTGAGSSRGKAGGRNPSVGSGHGKVSSLRQCNVCMHVIKENQTTPAEEEMLEELHKNVLKIAESSSSDQERTVNLDKPGKTRCKPGVSRVGSDGESSGSGSSKSAVALAELPEGDADDSLDSDRGIPLLPLDSGATARDPMLERGEAVEGVDHDTPLDSSDILLGACASEITCEVNSSDSVKASCSDSHLDNPMDLCRCKKTRKKRSGEFDHSSDRKGASVSPNSRERLLKGKSPNTVLFRQCPSCQKSSLCITGDAIQDVLVCDHSLLPHTNDLSTILEKQGLAEPKPKCCDHSRHTRKKMTQKKCLSLDLQKVMSPPKHHCHKSSLNPSEKKKKTAKHSNRSNSLADLSQKHSCTSVVSNPKRHSVTADYLYWTDDSEFRDSAFVEGDTFDQDSEQLESSIVEKPSKRARLVKTGVVCDDFGNIEDECMNMTERTFLLEKAQFRTSLRHGESKPLLGSHADVSGTGLTLSRSFDRESGFSSDC